MSTTTKTTTAQRVALAVSCMTMLAVTAPATAQTTGNGSDLPVDPFEKLQVKVTRGGPTRAVNPAARPAEKSPLMVPGDTQIEVAPGKFMLAKDLHELIEKWEGGLNEAGYSIGDEHLWEQPSELPSSVKAQLEAQQNATEEELKQNEAAARAGYRALLQAHGARRASGPIKHQTSRSGGLPLGKLLGKALSSPSFSKEFGNTKRFGGSLLFELRNELADAQSGAIIANGKALAWILGFPIEIIRVSFAGRMPGGTKISAEAGLYGLGQALWTWKKEGNMPSFKKRWPLATAKYSVVVPVGPIPVRISAGASAVADLDIAVERDPKAEIGIRARIEPGLGVDAFIEAGVDVALASAGVKGSLTLLKLSLPQTAGIALVRTGAQKWSAVETISSNIKTTLGAGRISLFLTARGPLCWAAKAISWAAGKVKEMFEGKAKRGIGSFFKKAAKAVGGAAKAIGKAVKSAGKAVVNTVKAVGKTVVSAGKAVVKTAVNFVKDPIGTTVKIVKAAVNVVKDLVLCEWTLDQTLFEFPGKEITTKLIGINDPPAVRYFPGSEPLDSSNSQSFGNSNTQQMDISGPPTL